MNLIPDYLREICMQSIILRFILAVLCSGLIGLSRGKRHHAAGFQNASACLRRSGICYDDKPIYL